MTTRGPRSNLPRDAARQRYIALAEVVLMESVRDEARRFDTEGETLPLGIYAQLDANAVAARDGKTRGAITNLFGSQQQFQTDVMRSSSDDRDYGGFDEMRYPDPADFPTAETWLEALAQGDCARGPQPGDEQPSGYVRRWLLWLTKAPYCLWSETLAEGARVEFAGLVDRLCEHVLGPGLVHFKREMAPGFTLVQMAAGMCVALEGVWVAQTCGTAFTVEKGLTTGKLGGRTLAAIWRGSTVPRAG